MHVAGHFDYAFDPHTVYEAFTNREALLFSTPGLRTLDEVEPGCYSAVVKVGVGGFSLVWEGALTVTNRVPDQGYRLLIDVKTRNGYARGEAAFQFTPREGGGTRLLYEGDVELGGAQKLLPSLARGLADFFLRGMEQWLTDPAVHVAQVE
jgi:uncharacterized protein